MQADDLRVGVLALQGAVGRHAEAFGALDVSSLPVTTADDLDAVDALVIPGGESTAISLLLGSSGLREPIAKRLADGMPAFGTCAGMILLATDILGGRPDQTHFDAIDVSVRRNAFGRQVQSFETDLDVAGLSSPFHAVFIRAPAVEEVGAGVEVLARVPGVGGGAPAGRGDGTVVLCRQGPVLVSSFHPELSGDPRLHRLFLDLAVEELSS